MNKFMSSSYWLLLYSMIIGYITFTWWKTQTWDQGEYKRKKNAAGRYIYRQWAINDSYTTIVICCSFQKWWMIKSVKYMHVLPRRHLTKDSWYDCHDRTKDLYALLVDLSTIMIVGKVIICGYLLCNYKKKSKIPCKYKLLSNLNRTFMTGVHTSPTLECKLVEQLYEWEEKDRPTETRIRENKRKHSHIDTHCRILIKKNCGVVGQQAEWMIHSYYYYFFINNKIEKVHERKTIKNRK